jgi:leucyl-tRNA---protein transferase
MADMDAFDYASMVDETPVNTMVVEYHEENEVGTQGLVAACLSDVLGDGLSMVYSFFEPELADRSLGAFMILDHIAMAREMGLGYVYLGYWVSGSRKMDYKTGYRPFELCDGATWRRFTEREEVDDWQAQRFRIVQDRLLG